MKRILIKHVIPVGLAQNLKIVGAGNLKSKNAGSDPNKLTSV